MKRDREPIAACAPWALVLLAVVVLLPLQCGCHATHVNCHGPVTVEATVDAEAGLLGGCKCCPCEVGGVCKTACELKVE